MISFKNRRKETKLNSGQMSRKALTLTNLVLLFMTGFMIFSTSPGLFAQALSGAEKKALLEYPNWVGLPGAGIGCSPTSGPLTGNDNIEKAYNFLTGKGLTAIQSSGIIGNLQQESGQGLSPTADESGHPATSPTPNVGFGIAQWTDPGRQQNLVAFAQAAGTPVTDLGVQLGFLWQEFSTGYPGAFADFKKTTTIESATLTFMNGYEAPNAALANAAGRIHNAQVVYDHYGGGAGSGDTTGGSTPTGDCTSTPPGTDTNCDTVKGNPKILCEAKKYNGIYYRWGGGHQGYAAFIAGCPDPLNAPNNQPTGSPPDPTDNNLSGNPSPCATDCSGLVSIAVDSAFNLSYMWSVSGSMQGAGSQFWKSIPIAQAQPGDIVTTPEHVEIVDHISGNTVFTFGSPSTGEITGPHQSTPDRWSSGAWQWIGPGSGN